MNQAVKIPQEVMDILARHGGDKDAAADEVGVTRRTMFYWAAGDRVVPEPSLRLMRRLLTEKMPEKPDMKRVAENLKAGGTSPAIIAGTQVRG